MDSPIMTFLELQRQDEDDKGKINWKLFEVFVATLQTQEARLKMIDSSIAGPALREIISAVDYKNIGILPDPKSIKSKEELDFVLAVIQNYCLNITD